MLATRAVGKKINLKLSMEFTIWRERSLMEITQMQMHNGSWREPLN